MTEYIVYQPDGSQRTTIGVDDKAYLEKSVMDYDRIKIPILVTGDLNAYNSIGLRDYIIFQGNKYYLNRYPQPERLAKTQVRYTFTFEGEIYTLLNKLFIQPVTGASKFWLTDTLDGILSVLGGNVDDYESGWTFTTGLTTQRKSILFDGDSCRNVLNKLANEFDVEFYLSGRDVVFVDKFENDTLLSFSTDLNSGLYELKRLNVDTNNTITRAYLFGGTKNITADYGYERLTLPTVYVEDLSEYGLVVEKAVIFDDIFPRFEGTINAVDLYNGVNRKIYFDVDFDINLQLLSGTTAKVSFKTGDLTGRDFEINSESLQYNEVTGECELILIQLTDDGDLTLPNDVMYPKIGDVFTLIDIKMPQSYIDNAHAELLAKGEAWLSYYKQLRVKYELLFDPRYIRKNGISLHIGDTVTITDTGLGINQEIRITKLIINLDNTSNIKAEISNVLKETWEEDVQYKIQQTQDKVEIDSTQKQFDINATKDWVARNFAQLYSGNVFFNNQYFDGPLAGYDTDLDVVTWLQMITPDGHINNVAPMGDNNVNGGVAVWNETNQYFQANNEIYLAGLSVNDWCEITNLEVYNLAQFYDGLESDVHSVFNDGLTASGTSFFQGIYFGTHLFIWDNHITQQSGALDISAQDYINLIAGGFTHIRLYDDHIAEYFTDENYWTGYHQSYIYGGDGFDGSGWKMTPDYNGESLAVFDHVVIRRGLRASQMEIDEVTHAGGMIGLSAGHGKVSRVSGSNLYFDTDQGNNPIQFIADDYVFAVRYTGKDTGLFKGLVTVVNQADEYITVSTIYGEPYEGMELIQFGNNQDTDRQAMMFLNALGDPYIRLYSGVDDGTLTGKLLASYGYLGDINSPAHGQLSGDGIYVNRGFFENVKISGEITATGGNFDWLLANVINTNYIEGLQLDFDKGTLGGWYINSGDILSPIGQDGGYMDLDSVNKQISIVPTGDPGDGMVGMHYTASDNWGLIGTDSSGRSVFGFGSDNFLSAWSFDYQALWNGMSKSEPYVLLDAANRKIAVTRTGDFGEGYCMMHRTSNSNYGLEITDNAGSVIFRAGQWGIGLNESGAYIKGSINCGKIKYNNRSYLRDQYDTSHISLDVDYSMYLIEIDYTYIQGDHSQAIRLREMELGEEVNIIVNSVGADAGDTIDLQIIDGSERISLYSYNLHFKNNINTLFRITKARTTGTAYQQHIIERIIFDTI